MNWSGKQLNITYSYCRYKKLLSSVDLTKDFFFSYTYPIMQSLQKNVSSDQGGGMPYDNIFVWNAYLTQSVRSRCNNTIWTIALVHGHFRQVSFFISEIYPWWSSAIVKCNRIYSCFEHVFKDPQSVCSILKLVVMEAREALSKIYYYWKLLFLLGMIDMWFGQKFWFMFILGKFVFLHVCHWS